MEQGVKFDKDKLRFDLIPTFPMRLIAEVFTIGAKKYTDRNWEEGMEWGRVYGAINRHLNAWWSGEKYDPDDGQHHLASVACGAMVLMQYEETHPNLDTRSKYKIEFTKEDKNYEKTT